MNNNFVIWTQSSSLISFIVLLETNLPWEQIEFESRNTQEEEDYTSAGSNNNDDNYDKVEPYSFVPVVVVSEGNEFCPNDELMKLRPQLDLTPIYEMIGHQAPNANAQLTSSPITTPPTKHSSSAEFEQILSQVKR